LVHLESIFGLRINRFPSVVLSGAELKEPMRYGFLFILLGILIVGNEELVYGLRDRARNSFQALFQNASPGTGSDEFYQVVQLE
jgi:hypothetical protein